MNTNSLRDENLPHSYSSFDVFVGGGSRTQGGRTIEEAAAKWREELSASGKLARAASLRAEADRLEREAAK